MIEITHPILDKSIEIYEHYINTLVIENPTLLYNFVSSLLATLDGGESDIKILANVELYREFSKIYFASSVFDINFNSKKAQTTIQKQLSKLISQHEYKFYELYNQGYVLLSKLLEEIEIPINLSESIDISSLIKLYNPTIEDNYEKLIERIVMMVNLMIELFDLKVFITLNLQDFLTEDEMLQLLHHCENKEVVWLSIQSSLKSDLSQVKCTLIDNDLCQILA